VITPYEVLGDIYLPPVSFGGGSENEEEEIDLLQQYRVLFNIPKSQFVMGT
jgi:hypothetical protein